MSSQSTDSSSVAMVHSDLIRHSDFQNIAVGDIDAYRLSLQGIARKIKEKLGIDVEASDRWLDLAELQDEIQRSRSTQKDSQCGRKAKSVIDVGNRTGLEGSFGSHAIQNGKRPSRSALERSGDVRSRAVSGPSPRRSKRIQRRSMSPSASARSKSSASVKLNRVRKQSEVQGTKLHGSRTKS